MEFFFFAGHMTGFSKAISFKKNVPFQIQSVGAVIQLQTGCDVVSNATRSNDFHVF